MWKTAGGNLGYAVQWYFLGKDPGYILKTGASGGGYFKDSGIDSFKWKYEPDGGEEAYEFTDLAGLKDVLDVPFHQQGVAAYLSIAAAGYGSSGHAISCWGYETDDSGQIVALYITDSDDHQFGARRLTVEERNGSIYLNSSNPLGTYGEGDGSYILGSVSCITDPNAVSKSGNTALSSVIAASSDSTVAISEAVEAKGAVSSTKGICLEEGGILAAQGKENHTSLTLGVSSGTAAGTGLDAELGSMLNLRDVDLSISNFAGNGLSVQTEAYIDNGNVSIRNNRGTGISVTNSYSDYAVYLEMSGNGTVSVSGNQNSGLYVSGVYRNYVLKRAKADLSHNTTVEFTGNQTASRRGGAIAASGELVLSDITNLSFTGNKSTYKDNYNGGSGGGGAIGVLREWADSGYSTGAVTIADSGTVLFSGNEAYGNGGAVSSAASFTMKDNGTIRFTGNKATDPNALSGGGALAAAGGASNGKVLVTGTKTLLAFEDNTAKAMGGALYSQGKMTISDNADILIKGNEVLAGGSYANGGAMAAYNGCSIEFTGNRTSIDIQGNTAASKGGALYALGTITMTGNGDIGISGNKAASGSAIYAEASSTIALENNKSLGITGNVAAGGATAADVIYNGSADFSISGNGAVEFSGNSMKGGCVINNATSTAVMEIAHNESVSFSGNTSTAEDQADIKNAGTLYISADEGKTITFENGIKNSGTGTTYIGKDKAGNVSTGGTYVFTDGRDSVTLETSVATLKADGGALFTFTDFGKYELGLSHAELDSAAFTLDYADLALSDVSFADDAVVSIDLGGYQARNYVTLDDIGTNVQMQLKLSLEQATATTLSTQIISAGPTETVLLSNYLGGNADLTQLDISLVLDGWMGEGAGLVVDTAGLIGTDAVFVKNYNLVSQEGDVLYYIGKAASEVPEPATTSLSLLALTALLSRRRRKESRR